MSKKLKTKANPDGRNWPDTVTLDVGSSIPHDVYGIDDTGFGVLYIRHDYAPAYVKGLSEGRSMKLDEIVEKYKTDIANAIAHHCCHLLSDNEMVDQVNEAISKACLEHSAELQSTITSLEAVVGEIEKCINDIWWEDNCGWIMINNKETECGKCGSKVTDTTLNMTHEDWCIQGKLHTVLTALTNWRKEFDRPVK